MQTADYSCLDAEASAGHATGIGSAAHTDADSRASGAGWFSVDFVLMCLLLFVYLGIENVAQGWFVTYFQDTGIMSETLSTLMVSLTWVMIMLGRLFIATFCANRNKFSIILILFGGIFVSSFLMIAAHSAAVATLSVAIIGLFMSGCYPTTFAAAGPIMGIAVSNIDQEHIRPPGTVLPPHEGTPCRAVVLGYILPVLVSVRPMVRHPGS